MGYGPASKSDDLNGRWWALVVPEVLDRFGTAIHREAYWS